MQVFLLPSCLAPACDVRIIVLPECSKQLRVNWKLPALLISRLQKPVVGVLFGKTSKYRKPGLEKVLPLKPTSPLAKSLLVELSLAVLGERM